MFTSWPGAEPGYSEHACGLFRMDLQQTRDPRGLMVDENARLSCAAKIKKRTRQNKKPRSPCFLGKKKITHRARRRCDRVRGVPLPWPICPSRVGGEGASGSGTRADGPLEASAVVFVPLVLAGGVSGSSPADLLVPFAITTVVMDGRAVFRDSMPPPASPSLSLRFSLRACDFEYGARDASSPETMMETQRGSRDVSEEERKRQNPKRKRKKKGICKEIQ